MGKSARSIQVFSIYMAATGISLMLAPVLVLGLFSVPPTTEVWIRVVGMLMLWIGLFQFVMARHELRPLFIWTVVSRISTFFILLAFVMLSSAPVMLIAFGLVDLLGAGWTWVEIRKEERA